MPALLQCQTGTSGSQRSDEQGSCDNGHGPAHTIVGVAGQGDDRMSRMPRVTGAQLVRALKRAGWFVTHQLGSHTYLRHPDRIGIVTVPVHARRIMKPKVLTTILKQAGISADELREML